MNELERLGRALAREQDALRARSPARARARERIAALEPGERRARRRAWPLAAAAFAGLAAAAAFALFARAPAPAALELRLGGAGARIAAGAWLEAPQGTRPLGLAFSDGTRVELEPRTRARVVELDARGAHLLLESGAARVAVEHGEDTRYRLSVGPFAVRVVGTRFEVRWDPEQDRFRLDLREGAVELAGCVFGQGYRLEAGQAVDASCRHGLLHVGARFEERAPAAEDSVARADAAEPALAPAAPPAREQPASRRPRPTSRSEGAKTWRALAERGRYAEAFAQASALGFEAECLRAGADELALLAETARFAGQRTHEARALLAMRRRFPGTPRAALAAFALGRLEFDVHHSHSKAARWFGTYLKEQPRGALAREAQGRLLEAAFASGDRERARSLAARYLREHPAGPHAALAEKALAAGAARE